MGKTEEAFDKYFGDKSKKKQEPKEESKEEPKKEPKDSAKSQFKTKGKLAEKFGHLNLDPTKMKVGATLKENLSRSNLKQLNNHKNQRKIVQIYLMLRKYQKEHQLKKRKLMNYLILMMNHNKQSKFNLNQNQSQSLKWNQNQNQNQKKKHHQIYSMTVMMMICGHQIKILQKVN